jgi:hypothetical protein
MLAGREILNPHLEPLRAVVVDRIGEQVAPVRHRQRAEPEIFLALGESGFVEDQLIGSARNRLAPPFAILSAGLERGPVEPVAILLRNRGIVFLDAPLHLFVEPVGQRLVRRHHAFEIQILRRQIREHVLVGDVGVVRILEPRPRVVDRHAVRGERMRSLFGDGRRGGIGHHHPLRVRAAGSRADCTRAYVG